MNLPSPIQDFLIYPFLTQALIGIMIISLCSGLLSPIVVAKRFAFLGEAISHSTLLSFSLALFILSPEQSFLLLTLTLSLTFLLVIFLAIKSLNNNLPSDTLIGIFLTGSLSLAIIILSQRETTSINTLSLLFGNLLLIDRVDIYFLIFLLVLLLISIFPFYQYWIYFLFDLENARTDGVPTRLLHFGLYFLLCLFITSSLKVTGALLVNSVLIFPGAFALKQANSMKQTFIYSVIFSMISCFLGLISANYFNLPPGATIAFTQFSISILISKNIFNSSKRE